MSENSNPSIADIANRLADTMANECYNVERELRKDKVLNAREIVTKALIAGASIVTENVYRTLLHEARMGMLQQIIVGCTKPGEIEVLIERLQQHIEEKQ